MTVSSEDLSRVVAAARKLDIRAREAMWVSASLCVLDAVWSIGANYDSTVVPLIQNFAQANGINRPVVSPSELPAGDPFPTRRLSQFSEDELLDRTNRQRTSTRNGITKAKAAIAYASVLTANGVLSMSDASKLLRDPPRLAQVERELSRVRGHGAGVRMAYLWMLLGDDNGVKPDRMVIRWLQRAIGRESSVDEARVILADASVRLGGTLWELDHAIWLDERGRNLRTGRGR